MLLCLAVVAISCRHRQENVKMQEFSAEELCVLEQVDRPIGEIYSMSVINDTTLLLTTESEVMRYSVSGKYMGYIGHKGRAYGEYGMPMKVRADGNSIYVWDAMGLKFLKYDSDANFIDEYQYQSALKEFIPCGDKIIIYTAGVREGNLVDIYDINNKTVVKSLTESSPAQRVYNSVSVYPMSIDSVELYYMPCCELKLYKYDLRNGEREACLFDVKSDSFNVPEIDDEEALFSERSKLGEFYDETSSVMAIVPMISGIKVMTCEGVFYRKNGQRESDKKYYSVYDLDANGMVNARKVIPYDTFESKSAMNFYDGELYFLKKETAGNEESHILFRHSFE